MTRLHTESLCSYSGRSDSKAESIWIENNQMGNWSINPWYINSPSFDVSEIDGNQLNTLCGFMGNCKIEESEVSRGHSSQCVSVMAGARRRTEHSTRQSLLQPDSNIGVEWRNRS